MEYVDLGLSVLWADCNVGANAPEKYGENLMFDTAINSLNVSVPSIEQWQELMDKCDWKWTKQNGVKGYKVASKVNNNSIFLPAAGFRDNVDLDFAGSKGSYWSSTLSPDVPYPYNVWNVHFNSTYIVRVYAYRYFGRSVRPVLKRKVEYKVWLVSEMDSKFLVTAEDEDQAVELVKGYTTSKKITSVVEIPGVVHRNKRVWKLTSPQTISTIECYLNSKPNRFS